jgi:hypothetical protein
MSQQEDDVQGRRIGGDSWAGRSARLAGNSNLGNGGASRREFLRASAATLGSFLLPRCLRAGVDDKRPWFFHAIKGDSWPVADPVAWSLENALQPALGRASEGLRKLTSADGERVIRLVTRRCALNLIEIHPDRVDVHHWGCQGLADLRPFFRYHGLARRDVEVVVRDRKHEQSVTRSGDDYLYGEALAPDLPLGLFIARWRRRFDQESDDWSVVPGTWSGYGWSGVEDNRIPWAALKSAWRRTESIPCQNCDRPTLLTNFGYPFVGMFNRYPRFVHACARCRRSFLDLSVKDVRAWLMANLDAEVRPEFEMIWDRRVRLRTGEIPHSIELPRS